MVIKILSGSASFHGVEYNTDKIRNNKGELMKVANFGPLQGIGNLQPEDYKNYLKALSAQNKRVKAPQLHAVISAKGREHDKQLLTAIATQWLSEMGYGNQPYLVVFHKDTNNNHVHLVSTRIGRDGKKISSAFENVRAILNLNKVMGLDEKVGVKQDTEKAFTYNVATKAQFMMVLEQQGYVLKEVGDHLDVIKFGKVLGTVLLSRVAGHIQAYQPNRQRQQQVKAIILKYAGQYDAALKRLMPGGFDKPGPGYTSELAVYLKEKHGLDLLFHAKDDKQPYGYSIIDHAKKAVYKGGEVLSLTELLDIAVTQQPDFDACFDKSLIVPTEKNLSREQLDYYSALLKAILYNYPDLGQGLHHQGLTLVRKGNSIDLADYTARVFIPVNELLGEQDYEKLLRQYAQQDGPYGELESQFEPPLQGISIAGDIDDEQVNGRNRRRKRKARTNTR